MSSNSSLNDLCKDFDEFLEQFPGMQRDLVEMAGEKLHQKVLQNIDTAIKDANNGSKKKSRKQPSESKGRMKDACRLVIGSSGGYAAVRNDYKKAGHTHLWEFGHNIVVGGKLKPTQEDIANGKKKGEVVRWFQGRHMYRNAVNELEDELVADAEKMIDKLVGDLF